MNRSSMIAAVFCALFVIGSVEATWYSPVLRLGKILKTQIVQHKSIIAGALMGVIAHMGFDKLRDWKIRREKNEMIGRMRETLNVAEDFAGEEHAETSTWGKPWSLRVIGRRQAGQLAQLSVIDGWRYQLAV